MGIYDTFLDRDMEVQLKFVEDSFETYKPGDKLPKGYPRNCQAFCFASPDLYVTIKGGKFKGITGKRDRKLPLFKCDGELVKSAIPYWKEAL